MIKHYFLLFTLCSLILVSCGTPNDPESVSGTDGGYKIIGRLATSGFAQDIVIKDSIAYVAQGEGGLAIINISDRQNPKLISMVKDKLKGYSYKIILKDSVVYLSAGNFGVSVVNVSKPLYPDVTATNLQMKPAKSFYILDNYLLTTVGEYGINIAEISSPTLPDIRGTILTPGFTQGICATQDKNTLLAACGEMGFAMINISDFQNGFGEYPLINWMDTPGYAEDIIIHPTLPVAFLACGTSGLVIIDYSDSSNLKIKSTIDIGGYAKELIYKNGKIFITTETRGLQIFDVTNLSSPVRIATVKAKYPKGIAMDDKYIYLADKEEGLVIISKP